MDKVDFKIERNNDREYVLNKVKTEGKLLDLASDELKEDKELVWEAIKNNAEALEFAGTTLKGDKEKFLSLGMDGYISKPINSEELKTIFNIFLSTKELIIEKSENKPSNDNIKIEEVKIANKLGINENIVRLIINKFKSEITKDLEELRDFINRNDIENISQKAHYIKNSCLNVALDEACEILEQLEDKSLEESRKKELFNQLDNQLGNF